MPLSGSEQDGGLPWRFRGRKPPSVPAMSCIPAALHRRPALRLLALLALSVPMMTSLASPPAQRQAPGFYRQSVGTLRVTALFDGVVALPRTQLQGIDPAGIQALLKDRHVPETPQGLQTAVNAYLIDDGTRLSLVDTGTADCFGAGLGQVLENLRAAGYAPAEVDNVLLTHAHPDHLCGLLDREGRPAYPQAAVWLARADADYWLDPATEQDPATPAMLKPLFGMARKAVAPYRAARKLRLFGPGDRLPGSVEALASPGHTPGHTSYLFKGSEKQALLVWGDIVHYHVVQFARPDASFEADADRAQAIASRRRLMAGAADAGWWLAGAHLPFPGLGHIRRDRDAYAWVPAEFSPLPTPP